MPALPPVPSVVRCRVIGSNQTKPFNNILYLQFAGSPPTATDCVTVGNAVLSAYGTAFRSWLPPAVTLEECEVTDLTSDTSAQGSGTTTQTGTDVNAQDQPLSAATVISFLINRHYRGGHPRMYLPFCASLYLQNGSTFTNTYLTGIRLAAETFHSGMNAITAGGSSYTHVAVSYYLKGALRAQGIPFPIQGTAVHTRIDSQRRRTGKEAV